MARKFTRTTFVDRARARLLGRSMFATKRGIVRRARLGEQPDEGWPGAYVDDNPVAARLRRATEEGR